MLICDEVASFEFEGEDPKEVYIRGCKYLAKYIKSQNKNEQLMYSAERVSSEAPKFKFTVYTQTSLEKRMARYCNICQNFHKSFYINETSNCSICSLRNFMKHEREALSISREEYKKKVK